AVGTWFVPTVAKSINHRFPPLTTLAIAAAITIVGLFALAPSWPWFGLIPTVLLMCLMSLVGFTVGRFLHSVADSSQRATLLSVKGLAFNLGYGAYSLGFSLLIAGLRGRGESENILPQALMWQAVIVTGVMLAYFLWAMRKRNDA
ncbi:MAG: hypothetical protein AAGB14_15520, partial [Verrucomicrobiota bacterium]